MRYHFNICTGYFGLKLISLFNMYLKIVGSECFYHNLIPSCLRSNVDHVQSEKYMKLKITCKLNRFTVFFKEKNYLAPLQRFYIPQIFVLLALICIAFKRYLFLLVFALIFITFKGYFTS